MTIPSSSARAPTYVVAGQAFVAPPLAPGLYLVATPIGNLRDITLRALETLAGADLILCEDTRLSARLLDHYGISGPRAALHEHNETHKSAEIVARLGEGARIALISDAGTPLLSDPGFPLVRAARAAGLPVYAVPGASALLAGLTVAGLPTDRFSFFGFPPAKAGARAQMLADLGGRGETLIFYESPRRLAATLSAMGDAFGVDRQAVVALELTKKFERTRAGALGKLAAFFAQDETRGEAVILVAGAPVPAGPDPDEWREALRLAMTQMPLKTAVAEIAARYGLRRNEVYDAALALKA